jgi:hypothetical protein
VLSARIAGVASALLLLGGAQIASTLLGEAAAVRLAGEADEAARGAAGKAREALAGQSRAVLALAQGTLGNRPFVAALDARLERAALGDVLATAPWWVRYRSLAVAVSYQENAVAFVHPAMRGLPFSQLISRVRASSEPAAAFLAGPARAHVVAAQAIPSAASLPPAVLVLARPIDDQMLAALAASAGGSVMVIDGNRTLGQAGPDAELLQRAMPSDRTDGRVPGLGVAVVSLGGPLSLLVGSRPESFVRAQAEDRKRRVLLWAVAVLLAAPILIISLRHKPAPPARGRLRPVTVVRPPARPAAGSAEPAAAPAPPPRPAPLREKDAVLGRYRLVEKIGEGATAEVFTAMFTGAGGVQRSVVIKRLRPELSDNPTARGHFTDDAKLISKLVHPNLGPVFDCGEAGGTYFIAEEYIVGRDLGRLTRRLSEAGRPPLSLAGMCYVAHEVLGGLAYLHSSRPGLEAPSGFVYRDIAPSNVMISRLGEVKLVDFRIVRAHQSISLTELGTVKGHVDFMSPEQARGRGVDHRSDIFSAGLLLYHCAAGRSLYRGETHYDRLSRAAQGPGVQELERINALPPPLPKLLLRALATNPDARYQAAAEFRAAVASHAAGGEDEVAGLVSDLFADELQEEIDRLSDVAAPPAGARPGSRAS